MEEERPLLYGKLDRIEATKEVAHFRGECRMARSKEDEARLKEKGKRLLHKYKNNPPYSDIVQEGINFLDM